MIGVVLLSMFYIFTYHLNVGLRYHVHVHVCSVKSNAARPTIWIYYISAMQRMEFVTLQECNFLAHTAYLIRDVSINYHARAQRTTQKALLYRRIAHAARA